MRFASILSSIAGVIVLLTPAVTGKLCFVIYQMADNDLEYFIRQDLGEYMQSDLMQDPNTISWIYFDNGDPDAYGDSPEPLPDIYDINGDPLDNRTQDVYYLSYNHDFGQMEIIQNLGELNSDTEEVVQDFVTTAFRDCKEKGATEYMMAFSSHGAGFGGFGGDEVTRRRRLEGLLDNGSITGAIRTAIDSEIGVGAKLNVLGFDACLMMDYGALDEYGAITENFLASEDVEPGHGWSYTGLKSDSAVNVAAEIVELFASDPQSDEGHQTPKTLAVIDTAAHAEFASKWEDFSRLLTIAYKEDENVQAAVKRARTEVLTFAGDTDFEGDKDQDMVDMMDFMRLFDEQCMPTGDLGAALMEAQNSYSAQFVTFKIGPGTDSRYTGMGVLFPSKKEKQASGLDEQLFTSDRYATKSSPNWLDFLRTYYTSKGVSGSGGYCTSGLATEEAPEEVNGLLMINPTVSGIINGGHDVEAGVVKRVDDLFIEFGVDITDVLQSRRHLLKARTSSKPSLPMGRRADERFLRHELKKQSRRRLQFGSGDYLYVYGGELAGSFVGSKYSATWDRQFIVVGTSADDLHPAYVYTDGENGKEMPVLYFPPNKPVTSEDVVLMEEFEDAEAAGAMAAFIKFSTDSGIATTLYTTDGNDAYSETPNTAGGQIVPIVFAEGMIDGVEYYYLIGGLEGAVFDWSSTTPLIIETKAGDDVVADGGILTLDIYAEDYDTGDASFAFFEIVDGVPYKFAEGNVDGLVPDDGGLTDDGGLVTDDGDLTDDGGVPDDGGLLTDDEETDPPTNDLTTEVPLGTNPPTTRSPTAAPGGATEVPKGTDAPRGIDSSAPAASTSIICMALAASFVHLLLA